MNFRPELAAKVMAGEKTVTRRATSENLRSPWWRGGCSLKTYRDYAICPGRKKDAIGRVEVVRVNQQPLHLAMQPGEARLEGFKDFDAFKAAWVEINKDWDPMLMVWRVEFRVVEAT